MRAAADVADDPHIVVAGSQAILGQCPDARAAMLVSMEADVHAGSHPARTDLTDGTLEEGSMFRDTFGHYAHGVGKETTTAPAGWRDRLVPSRNVNTRGATCWCLEAHDLVLAKCVAGREKDRAFADEAIRHGRVSGDPEPLGRILSGRIAALRAG